MNINGSGYSGELPERPDFIALERALAEKVGGIWRLHEDMQEWSRIQILNKEYKLLAFIHAESNNPSEAGAKKIERLRFGLKRGVEFDRNLGVKVTMTWLNEEWVMA